MERDSLLCLSSWCLVIVVWHLLAMQWVCLQIVIVVFPDHTHGLFLQIYLYLVTIFGSLYECALITRPCKHP